jgi:hypothetical protein
MSEEMTQLYGELREVKRALFGDVLRQEVGLVKTVDLVERQTAEIARQQAELMKLLPLVEELRREGERRREEAEELRANRVSRGLLDVARILTVLLLAVPAVAWDVRRLWLGVNPLAGMAVLAAAVGLFAVGSIVTRRVV